MNVTGVLKNGFSYSFPEENLDDMELIDALVEADNGNPVELSKAVKLMLGEDQKKALYNHIKETASKVTVETMAEVITEILESMGEEGKK